MRELNRWFEKNQRDFPWRRDRTPYKVWISEVMLQQTRASVVVSYFEKWMILFPNVKALSSATIEEVIKAWEGLGYYSRARNLHRASKQIVEKYGEQIPQNREALEQIHGLGPYTVSAILSFGFKKRTAAVDGNVTRVLSRFLSIKENTCKQAVKRKIQKGADALLDSEEPWVSSEALIELGAVVCTPKPACEICPLEQNCLGRKIAESLPIKNPRKKIIPIKRAVILFLSDGKTLLKKGEPGKVMADLYEFPYFEMGNELWPRKKIVEAILETFGIEVQKIEKLKMVTHSFTCYKAELFPFRFQVDSPLEIEGYRWVEEKEIESLPFSSGHRRILSL